MINSELLSHVNIKGQNIIDNSLNKNIFDTFSDSYSNNIYDNLILNNNILLNNK